MKTTYKLHRKYPHLHRLIHTLGGTAAIQQAGFIKLENPPYEQLNIEVIGDGFLKPKGYHVTCTIALSHIYIQEGDLMRDPEVTLDYYEDQGLFIPLTYRQDAMGKHVEAIYRDESGEFCQRTGEHRSLCSFMHTWQTNLRDQGFITIAKRRQKGCPNRIAHTLTEEN